MYWELFALAFLCFSYHTAIHVLEHLRRIPEIKAVFISIGLCMLLGWVSYFYISFSGLELSLSLMNYAGLALLLVGFYLFFVSHAKVHKRMHSGKGGLVTEGIYRHIRHPMYLGEILMLLGAPLFGGSSLTLMLSPLFIVQILVWRYMEEKELLKEFPGYAAYKKKTLF